MPLAQLSNLTFGVRSSPRTLPSQWTPRRFLCSLSSLLLPLCQKVELLAQAGALGVAVSTGNEDRYWWVGSYGVQCPPKIQNVCQHSMFANNIQLLVATSILVYIDFHLHTTQCPKVRFNFQLCDTTSDSKNESSNLKVQLRTLRR